MDDLDCKRKIEEKARMGITNEKFASTSAYNFFNVSMYELTLNKYRRNQEII